MPQSRQRKINKAKKRPRVPRAGTVDSSNSAASNNLKLAAIVIVAAVVLGGVVYFLWQRNRVSAAEVTTPSGLKYVDKVVGTGESPQVGQEVTVNYTGTLEDGTKFDSSLDRGQPFTFRFGRTPMIKGWDEGISTMKVGGSRHLIVPSRLGYGAQPKDKIPPNSTLVFDIDLISVK